MAVHLLQRTDDSHKGQFTQCGKRLRFALLQRMACMAKDEFCQRI